MSEKQQINKKRLLLDVPVEIHQEVKIRATKRNIKIREWLLRAIVDAIKSEQQYE